jgi:hypothetical protein
LRDSQKPGHAGLLPFDGLNMTIGLTQHCEITYGA